MVTQLFDLSHTMAGRYLSTFAYPWEALKGLEALIRELGKELDEDQFECFACGVWIHKTAQVAPTAHLGAPCIIGAGTQVRHGAFVRGAALVGENCVVGNSVEVKNSILFDGVQVPHYNYVGDSILGFRAHMGAGAVTSNVKSDKKPVVIHTRPPIPTGIKKGGAMVGDFAEIGCNSVLNPGTVIGRNATVYPLSSVRGIVPENSIYKSAGVVVLKA